MGIGTNAFISGFTGQLKDSIDKREEADRERQKSVFLEELRRDTYKWQKDIEEAYEGRKPDKNQEQYDYSKGVKILRNSRGEQIGETPLTESEKEAYGLERRATMAGLTKAETDARYADPLARARLASEQAQVESARASAANSRAGADLARRQGRSLDGSAGGQINDIADVANELRYRYKNTINDAVKSGIPAEAIDAASLRVLAEAKRNKWGKAKTEAVFQDTISRLRIKYPKAPAGSDSAL